MEEENGGVLHIIFIFIGIGLICFGTFYFFTDDKKVDSEEIEEKKNNNIDKDIINQINMMNNVETSITLKNKKEVKIRYVVDSATYIGSFYLDNKLVFETSSELETCEQFYIYNDSIISYCTYGSATSGHLYVINSNGTSIPISSFMDKNYKMIPESIQVKSGKLVVNGMRVSEGSVLEENDKNIELCNEEDVINNNIDLKSVAYANYELVVKNNKPEFIYMNTTKTLEEFIEESCKTVD